MIEHHETPNSTRTLVTCDCVCTTCFDERPACVCPDGSTGPLAATCDLHGDYA